MLNARDMRSIIDSFRRRTSGCSHPEDRRFRVWLSSRAFLIAIALVLGPLLLAWLLSMQSSDCLNLDLLRLLPKARRAGLMAFRSGFAGATFRICSFYSCSFAADSLS